MAMQKSDELKDVVKVMNRQFDSFGVAEWGCSIMIFDKKANRIENWVAESTNSDLSCYIIEGQRHPVYKRLWKHWEQQAPTVTLHHADEVKREFDNFWLYETDYKRLPDEVKSTVLNEREIFLTYSSMHHGLISVAGYKQLSEDQISILDRFSKVFEQTYTRFLDLQKAEAQAKEAEIEAALERVRAKAMAMHSSNDISDTMGVVFTELPMLGISSLRCGVVVLSKNSNKGVFYAAATTNESDSQTVVGEGDMSAHPIFLKQLEYWTRNENYFVTLSGEELKSYYKEIFRRSSIPYNPREHDKQTEHGYYFSFSEGMFYAWSEEPYSESDINILNFKSIMILPSEDILI